MTDRHRDAQPDGLRISDAQPKCDTGKRPYFSERQAKQVAIYLRQAHGMRLQRAYECDRCYQWHLTNLPQP
jgi:hypothetical protein